MSVLFVLAATAEALEFTLKKGKIMREKDDIQIGVMTFSLTFFRSTF